MGKISKKNAMRMLQIGAVVFDRYVKAGRIKMTYSKGIGSIKKVYDMKDVYALERERKDIPKVRWMK